MPRLPTVIVTSVIRSSRQGDSHGGVYLVDLETEAVRQVIDWDDASIDWTGRGGDRGLRGIAFHDDRVLIAASDEIFIFSRDFDIVGSIRNGCLRHCHEIAVRDDRLVISSTGFDSVLEYNLLTRCFTRGVCIRQPEGDAQGLRIGPYMPDSESTPAPGDTVHLNNVGFAPDGSILISFLRKPVVFGLLNEGLRRIGQVPIGTHNVQVDPADAGRFIFNSTGQDAVCIATHDGTLHQAFPIEQFDPGALEMNDLPEDHARQGFGRGLCTHEDLVIGGSSPSTISVYDRTTGTCLKRVNLTMDVRNAVHGLEVWPWSM